MKIEADCKTVHIGTVSITDGVDTTPRIKFYEIANDRITGTGKTVTIERDEWKRQLDVSNAIVAFFEDLTIMHPEVQDLMRKHGIAYREGDSTP